MKVPIRSTLTFCVPYGKSFKVHFEYKKYFIEGSWIGRKWIGRRLACVCAMKASDQGFSPCTSKGKSSEKEGDAAVHSHHRQCLLGVHVYLVALLGAFFTLMVAVSQGEYNSP